MSSNLDLARGLTFFSILYLYLLDLKSQSLSKPASLVPELLNAPRLIAAAFRALAGKKQLNGVITHRNVQQ
jgi:hypothetical protein